MGGISATERYATTSLTMRPDVLATLPSACPAVRRRSVSSFFCRSSASCFSFLQGDEGMRGWHDVFRP